MTNKKTYIICIHVGDLSRPVATYADEEKAMTQLIKLRQTAMKEFAYSLQTCPYFE